MSSTFRGRVPPAASTAAAGRGQARLSKRRAPASRAIAPAERKKQAPVREDAYPAGKARGSVCAGAPTRRRRYRGSALSGRRKITGFHRAADRDVGTEGGIWSPRRRRRRRAGRRPRWRGRRQWGWLRSARSSLRRAAGPRHCQRAGLSRDLIVAAVLIGTGLRDPAPHPGPAGCAASRTQQPSPTKRRRSPGASGTRSPPPSAPITELAASSARAMRAVTAAAPAEDDQLIEDDVEETSSSPSPAPNQPMPPHAGSHGRRGG